MGVCNKVTRTEDCQDFNLIDVLYTPLHTVKTDWLSRMCSVARMNNRSKLKVYVSLHVDGVEDSADKSVECGRA